jgi:Tfp pilus assembly protein PilV
MRGILRRLRRDESGLSMSELLISMLLTMGILVMVTSMFIQTTRITSASIQTRNSNGIAANVANEISAVLRVSTTLAVPNTTPAPAVAAGTRSSVSVYAYSNTSASDPAPVKVTFTLDALNRVQETRCVGSSSGGYWSFNTCASTSSRYLGQGILPPTGVTNQLFTYLDANNNPILIGTGALTLADREDVTSILVIVRAQPTTSKTDPVVIQNTIVLRNLGLDSGS